MSISISSAIRDEFYPTALLDGAVRWKAYRDELRVYSQAAEAAATATQRLIVRPVAARYPDRFVCCLDRSGPFVKSPPSIDDKIGRFLAGKPVAGDRITESIKSRLRSHRHDSSDFLSLFFQELPDVMNDLARFRIVSNFIADAQYMAKLISDKQLAAHGIDVDPKIEDRIESDRWEEGGSGHRAIHLRLFVPLAERRIHVEVQIVTILELGWDMKSHPLYELTRQGQGDTVSKRNRLKVHAVSGALYVADVLFEELFVEVFGEGDKR